MSRDGGADRPGPAGGGFAAAAGLDDPARFAVLRPVGRVWAVAAVRGEAERLRAVHAAMAERFRPGDRLVYLGDLVGPGGDSAGAVDEALRFRRWALAMPPHTHADDVVALRGGQEEMWRLLLQLQYAVDPAAVLDWMEARGVEATVAAYGGGLAEARVAAREGAAALGQWTSRLRENVRAAPGHADFAAMLKRAALQADGALLFVNAGLDPDRPLAEQGDRFWWDSGGPDRMRGPHPEAALVVRGADPARRGPLRDPHCLHLDAGCGEGGPLAAACLSPAGEVLETLFG